MISKFEGGRRQHTCMRCRWKVSGSPTSIWMPAEGRHARMKEGSRTAYKHFRLTAEALTSKQLVCLIHPPHPSPTILPNATCIRVVPQNPPMGPQQPAIPEPNQRSHSGLTREQKTITPEQQRHHRSNNHGIRAITKQAGQVTNPHAMQARTHANTHPKQLGCRRRPRA